MRAGEVLSGGRGRKTAFADTRNQISHSVSPSAGTEHARTLGGNGLGPALVMSRLIALFFFFISRHLFQKRSRGLIGRPYGESGRGGASPQPGPISRPLRMLAVFCGGCFVYCTETWKDNTVCEMCGLIVAPQRHVVGREAAGKPFKNASFGVSDSFLQILE